MGTLTTFLLQGVLVPPDCTCGGDLRLMGPHEAICKVCGQVYAITVTLTPTDSPAVTEETRDRLIALTWSEVGEGEVTKPRTISLTIPGMPAYALSPNSRCHWRVKHRESLDARYLARLAWFNHQLDTGEPKVCGPVILTWMVFLPKGGKRRDLDNLIPCMKPFLDGLVDGGAIEGDTSDIVKRIDVAQVPWSQHHGDPTLCVTIQEVTA